MCANKVPKNSENYYSSFLSEIRIIVDSVIINILFNHVEVILKRHVILFSFQRKYQYAFRDGFSFLTLALIFTENIAFINVLKREFPRNMAESKNDRELREQFRP